MSYTVDSSDTSNTCDRCGRPINGGYVLSLGKKICGVCVWEKQSDRLKDSIKEETIEFLSEEIKKIKQELKSQENNTGK